MFLPAESLKNFPARKGTATIPFQMGGIIVSNDTLRFYSIAYALGMKTRNSYIHYK